MPAPGLAIALATSLAIGIPMAADAAPPPPGAVPALASVPAADSALLAVRAGLIGAIETVGMPSISIALVHAGEVVWLESLGWADREAGLPAEPQTVYALGSLSKSITATALMRLVERARVRLEDPVNRHGVRLSDPLHVAAGLQVRHLLQMTGGIPHGTRQVHADGRGAPHDLARMLERQCGPVSRPGERFLYSNFSFGALEVVIEHASRRRFADFLRDDLFLPLGMRRSGADPDTAWRPRVARKYGSDGKPLTEDYVFLPRGGGGLYSCAADLARYARLHLGALSRDSVLGTAHLARLHDASQPGEPSHLRYMGGWGHLQGSFPHSLLSDGQVAGSNTALLLVPERQIGVVCLVNRSGGDAVPAAIEIVNALLPGYRDALFALIERLEAAEAAGGASALPQLEGAWAGRAWSGSGPLDVRMVVPAQGEPVLTIAGLGDAPLRRATFAARPDTVVEGITFRSPGLTGRLSGIDLVAGRRAEGARIEPSLRLDGDALVGYGAQESGDSSVPIVIELKRAR